VKFITVLVAVMVVVNFFNECGLGIIMKITKVLAIILVLLLSVGCANNQTRAMNAIKIAANQKIAVKGVCDTVKAAYKSKYISESAMRLTCSKMAVDGTRYVANHYKYVMGELENGSN
jgi:ActR/RegA family two-component response regulator